MTRTIQYIFITLLTSIFWNNVASACSCVSQESAEAHIQQTQIIFRGTPLATLDKQNKNEYPSITYGNHATTLFKVDEVWKGVKNRYIGVNHGLYGASCGVLFMPNEPSLIFANLDENGNYYTSMCKMPEFSLTEIDMMKQNTSFSAKENTYWNALKKLPSTRTK